MRYVDSWTTSDKRVLVYFVPHVLQKFVRHRQRLSRQPESGGVLLGRRRGQHVEVAYATSPFSTDERSRTGFVRQELGHQAAAIDLWAANEGKIDYLGEWHTHPEVTPAPSGIDRREWRLLTTGHSRRTPLVAVIVGTASLYVALLVRGKIDPLVASS